jgi:hypothetical protein
MYLLFTDGYWFRVINQSGICLGTIFNEHILKKKSFSFFMTGITETGSLRTLLDIMDWRIPLIGEMVKFLHFDSFTLKTIPDRGNEP